MFQIGEDKTEYRLISKEGVSTAEFEVRLSSRFPRKLLLCWHSRVSTT